MNIILIVGIIAIIAFIIAFAAIYILKQKQKMIDELFSEIDYIKNYLII